MHSHASSAYTQVYMLCRSSISTPLVVCRSETRGDADPLGHPRAPSLTEPGFANLVTGARAMTRADNRGLAGIPSAVLGLFVAGNLLVVVIGLLALVGAGVLEALTRRRA